MNYFINKNKTSILSYDGKEVEEFSQVGELRGGVLEEKRTYKKRGVKEIGEKKVKGAKGKRLLPETINEIKERINLEDPLQEIADDFGISYATVYTLRKKMEAAALDTIPG